MWKYPILGILMLLVEKFIDEWLIVEKSSKAFVEFNRINQPKLNQFQK